MNVYISIDGVIRNFVNKFHYHYEQAYIDVENPSEEFEYKVTEPICNDNLLNHFSFQQFYIITTIQYSFSSNSMQCFSILLL